MLTVTKLVAQGRGLAAALIRRAAHVDLASGQRRQARLEAVDSSGRQLGIALEPGTTMRPGDVLVAADGSLIAVKAAVQPVRVLRRCPQHGKANDLLRAAYHLGERYVEVQLEAERLLVDAGVELGGLIDGLHLIASSEQLPFEPEAAVPAQGHHGHGHDHGHHDHGHHDHGHHDHGHHDHGHGGHEHR